MLYLFYMKPSKPKPQLIVNLMKNSKITLVFVLVLLIWACGKKQTPSPPIVPVNHVKGITLSNTTMNMPFNTHFFNLKATITPADASDSTITWQVSDPTVSGFGLEVPPSLVTWER